MRTTTKEKPYWNPNLQYPSATAAVANRKSRSFSSMGKKVKILAPNFRTARPRLEHAPRSIDESPSIPVGKMYQCWCRGYGNMAGSQNGRIVRSVLCTRYQGVGLTSCSLSLYRFLGNKCPYTRKWFPVLGWASDLMFVLNEYRRYLFPLLCMPPP